MIRRATLAYGTLAGALGSVIWAFFIWLDTCCFFHDGGARPLLLALFLAVFHLFARSDGPVPALNRVTWIAIGGCAALCGLVLLVLMNLHIA